MFHRKWTPPPPPPNVRGSLKRDRITSFLEWYSAPRHGALIPVHVVEDASLEGCRHHPPFFDGIVIGRGDAFACALCGRRDVPFDSVSARKVNPFCVLPHASFCAACDSGCASPQRWRRRGGGGADG